MEKFVFINGNQSDFYVIVHIQDLIKILNGEKFANVILI